MADFEQGVIRRLAQDRRDIERLETQEGVADHGGLTGLGDNDHPQYLLAASYTAADVLAKVKTVDGGGSGLDADLVDGIDSNRIVYGSGDAKTNSRGSISTPLPSGFNEIEGGSGIGAPSGTWYHVITNRHTNTAADYQMQIAGQFFDPNEIYYRVVNNGSYGSWYKLWHSNNDGSGSGLDADTVDGAHYSLFRNAGCVVWRNATQAVGSGFQTVTFTGYINNSGFGSYWDSGTALYASYTGWYFIWGNCGITPTSTDNVGAGIAKNGVTYLFNQQRRPASTLGVNLNVAGAIYMSAGEYLQLSAYSGAGCTIASSVYYSAQLGSIYLGQ